MEQYLCIEPHINYFFNILQFDGFNWEIVDVWIQNVTMIDRSHQQQISSQNRSNTQTLSPANQLNHNYQNNQDIINQNQNFQIQNTNNIQNLNQILNNNQQNQSIFENFQQQIQDSQEHQYQIGDQPENNFNNNIPISQQSQLSSSFYSDFEDYMYVPNRQNNNRITTIKNDSTDKRKTRSSTIKEKQQNSNQKSSLRRLKKVLKVPDGDCAICTENLGFPIGTLKCDKMEQIFNSSHVYHYDCIHGWAQRKNCCPMCRKKFNIIYKTEKNNKVQEIKVQDQDFDEDEFYSNDEDYFCYICGENDNEDVLMVKDQNQVCSRCDVTCCHIYCHNPPLNEVPEWDYICYQCRRL